MFSVSVIYLKRCAQSARPWIKAVKEVKEVKTNKTKKLKKTLVQIWHKMVPKWSQNDPKMAPSRSQDGPKMPQEGHKKQQKHENETYWAPRGEHPEIKSPLGTQVGPQVDPFWTNLGDFLLTYVSSSISAVFWEGSEPPFVDSR